MPISRDIDCCVDRGSYGSYMLLLSRAHSNLWQKVHNQVNGELIGYPTRWNRFAFYFLSLSLDRVALTISAFIFFSLYHTIYNFNLTHGKCTDTQSNAPKTKKQFSYAQSDCMCVFFLRFLRSHNAVFFLFQLIPISHQYKYGFSRSMLTELMGSSRNHVVNVKPFSYGHFASGGNTIPWKEKQMQIKWTEKREWEQKKNMVNVFCMRLQFVFFFSISIYNAFGLVIEHQYSDSLLHRQYHQDWVRGKNIKSFVLTEFGIRFQS